MQIRDVLAFNLRKYRRTAKLSQEELAHRAEIDRTYISALERSVYGATVDVVDRLAVALGVEAAELLRVPPNRTQPGKPSAKPARTAPKRAQ
jgi:transcriptional regulator with XRE-family HTH domain